MDPELAQDGDYQALEHGHGRIVGPRSEARLLCRQEGVHVLSEGGDQEVLLALHLGVLQILQLLLRRCGLLPGLQEGFGAGVGAEGNPAALAVRTHVAHAELLGALLEGLRLWVGLHGDPQAESVDQGIPLITLHELARLLIHFRLRSEASGVGQFSLRVSGHRSSAVSIKYPSNRKSHKVTGAYCSHVFNT